MNMSSIRFSVPVGGLDGYISHSRQRRSSTGYSVKCGSDVRRTAVPAQLPASRSKTIRISRPVPMADKQVVNPAEKPLKIVAVLESMAGSELPELSEIRVPTKKEWGIFVDTVSHVALSGTKALAKVLDNSSWWTPACTLFASYAVAELYMLSNAVELFNHRPSTEALVLCLICSGLIVDNVRLAGSRAGAKFAMPVLQGTTRLSYVLHSCVPLLILSAVGMCTRAGVTLEGAAWDFLPLVIGLGVGELIRHELIESTSEPHGELIASLDDEIGVFCLAKKKHELIHCLLAVLPTTYVSLFLGYILWGHAPFSSPYLLAGSVAMVASASVPPRIHMLVCNLGEVFFLLGFLGTEGWLQAGGL